MKKYLPKTSKNSQGFTLVELLVVIVIIGILATIGVTVFGNAQASARDGRRKSEITSLAKSIETAKDYGVGTQVYKYDSTIGGNDFPRGIPVTDSKTKAYCVSTLTGSTTPPTAMSSNDTSVACSNTSGYVDLNTSITTATGNNLGAGLIQSWTLCARLEAGSTPFCVSSLTK